MANGQTGEQVLAMNTAGGFKVECPVICHGDVGACNQLNVPTLPVGDPLLV